MEKCEIRRPLRQKPLNRSLPKFARVITSGTPTLCKISSRYHYPLAPPPNMRKCASSDSANFFWFFLPPIAKTPVPIFTINTSNNVVSRKGVLFGVAKTKFYISTPFSPWNANFSPIFDGTYNITRQKGLNNGDAHL